MRAAISLIMFRTAIFFSVFVIIISAWTTTVFVMTVESDYSVKSGALSPQQKIIIIINCYNEMMACGCGAYDLTIVNL